jgi:hypothetical protein
MVSHRHLVRVALTCSVYGAGNHESKGRNNRYTYAERALLFLLPALAVLTHDISAADSPPADPDKLVYHAPGDVTWEVTADGLSGIQVGDRQLAAGGWSVFNAEHWFKDSGTGEVQTKEFSEKSIQRLDDRRARVTHVRGDVLCVAEYTFDGPDLLISARVENRHAWAPMNVVGFSGLTFEFDRPPDGLMMVQHVSYFQAHGLGLCHPGFWSKFGGSYATDDTAGVGTTPWRTGLMRTLTLWDYGSWAADRREADASRRLLYFAVAPVPPRGARTLDFKIRISRDTKWQYLLEPYRDHFQTTFGPAQYKADHRWIATDYVNKSQEAISPTNPYGFHDGARRIDTAEGASRFCDTIIPALEQHAGQGVILWGQGGDDPRRAMYRPDFDVLPPEVEQNWPQLKDRFTADNLKLGVCTRPRHLAVRRDWRHDQIIDINPDDAGHRAMLWRRFENMIGKGCTLFYLDSFGASFEDVKLMRHLREKMGPDILTFAEHQCDAIFPYSGGYSETTAAVAKNDRPAHYRVWSGVRNWEIFQYLCPEAQLAARLYQIEDGFPDDLEPVDSFFYRQRITPLLPVSDFRRVTVLGEIQRDFVDGGGLWKGR